MHESLRIGTFRRFYKTRAKVYSLEVTDLQYEMIEDKIREIELHKKEYKFNVLGLFAAGFHKKIGKEHSFYCAEFVKYIMEQAEFETKLPEIVKPEDFKDIDGLDLIYDGLLRKYKFPKVNITELLKENVLAKISQDNKSAV